MGFLMMDCWCDLFLNFGFAIATFLDGFTDATFLDGFAPAPLSTNAELNFFHFLFIILVFLSFVHKKYACFFFWVKITKFHFCSFLRNISVYCFFFGRFYFCSFLRNMRRFFFFFIYILVKSGFVIYVLEPTYLYKPIVFSASPS